MLNLLERSGERLLARLLPQATARAFCRPQTYCTWCATGAYRRVWIYADCSSESSACGGC
jgi:hypothetical protein